MVVGGFKLCIKIADQEKQAKGIHMHIHWSQFGQKKPLPEDIHQIFTLTVVDIHLNSSRYVPLNNNR